MYKIFIIPLLVILPAFAELDQGYVVYPRQVIQCLKNRKASDLKVLTDNNPYYLRGDFDGDNKPDYALEVRAKSGGTGVLICTGKGLLFLLGAGIGEKKFSDDEEDSFLAPHWEVLSQRDVEELRAWRGNVPYPIPYFKGEAIAMIWEDGTSLIYWDGKQFRWAGCERTD